MPKSNSNSNRNLVALGMLPTVLALTFALAVPAAAAEPRREVRDPFAPSSPQRRPRVRLLLHGAGGAGAVLGSHGASTPAGALGIGATLLVGRVGPYVAGTSHTFARPLEAASAAGGVTRFSAAHSLDVGAEVYPVDDRDLGVGVRLGCRWLVETGTPGVAAGAVLALRRGPGELGIAVELAVLPGGFVGVGGGLRATVDLSRLGAQD